MVKCCNGEIKNRTGHLFSHKYWIYLFVSFLNTTFLLIIKNKQTWIRYCNASSFVVVFRNGKNENYVNLLSIISTFYSSTSRLVVVVGVLSSLLVSCLWRIIIKVIGVGVSLSSLFFPCQQRHPFLWLRPSASAPHCCCLRCWVRARR